MSPLTTGGHGCAAAAGGHGCAAAGGHGCAGRLRRLGSHPLRSSDSHPAHAAGGGAGVTAASLMVVLVRVGALKTKPRLRGRLRQPTRGAAREDSAAARVVGKIKVVIADLAGATPRLQREERSRRTHPSSPHHFLPTPSLNHRTPAYNFPSTQLHSRWGGPRPPPLILGHQPTTATSTTNLRESFFFFSGDGTSLGLLFAPSAYSRKKSRI